MAAKGMTHFVACERTVKARVCWHDRGVLVEQRGSQIPEQPAYVDFGRRPDVPCHSNAIRLLQLREIHGCELAPSQASKPRQIRYRQCARRLFLCKSLPCAPQPPPTVAMVDVWGFGKTPFFERFAGRAQLPHETVGKNRCALHNNENTLAGYMLAWVIISILAAHASPPFRVCTPQMVAYAAQYMPKIHNNNMPPLDCTVAPTHVLWACMWYELAYVPTPKPAAARAPRSQACMCAWVDTSQRPRERAVQC